jgi:hypothetical protein
MGQQFEPGDNLVFQLESGFGLLRVLAVDDNDGDPVWHLRAYEELFPDVESAEIAFQDLARLHPSIKHMALTDRAFERTPAARLNNLPLTEEEQNSYRQWSDSDQHEIFDRSALLMLGLR